MEFLFTEGSATANQLMSMLSGNPSNSSVRTQLRILEGKGVIKHQEQDGKFVYSPLQAKKVAAESALSTVVKTFFRGSISQTVERGIVSRAVVNSSSGD